MNINETSINYLKYRKLTRNLVNIKLELILKPKLNLSAPLIDFPWHICGLSKLPRNYIDIVYIKFHSGFIILVTETSDANERVGPCRHRPQLNIVFQLLLFVPGILGYRETQQNVLTKE